MSGQEFFLQGRQIVLEAGFLDQFGERFFGCVLAFFGDPPGGLANGRRRVRLGAI